MRLLISIDHFHKGKEGTINEEAQVYIQNICRMMELDPDVVTYNGL